MTHALTIYAAWLFGALCGFALSAILNTSKD